MILKGRKALKIQIGQALERLQKAQESTSTKEVLSTKASSQLDQVHLSKEAQILSKALEVATSEVQSANNLEKIKALQEQIDKGVYNVDTEAVAETILKEHLSMS